MEFKNALFINFGGIGDEILFFPVLDSFKKKFPNSKITLALEPRSKSAKELTLLMDDVMCVDIKGKNKYFNILKFIFSVWQKKFDIVISSGKSPFIAIILFLTGIKTKIGYKTKTSFLLTHSQELNENQYAAKMYHDLLKPLGILDYENPKIKTEPVDFDFPKDYVAIHPGVSKMSVQKNIIKCPKIDFWINLIKGILLKNKPVVLLGGPDDEKLISEITKNEEILKNSNFVNFYMKTKNISQMAEVMKNANCVICADSAPLHCAVAVSSCVFAIFGPTNEEKLTPKSKNVTIVKNDLKCRPCLWHKRQMNCENSECLNIDYNLILDKIN